MLDALQKNNNCQLQSTEEIRPLGLANVKFKIENSPHYLLAQPWLPKIFKSKKFSWKNVEKKQKQKIYDALNPYFFTVRRWQGKVWKSGSYGNRWKSFVITECRDWLSLSFRTTITSKKDIECEPDFTFEKYLWFGKHWVEKANLSNWWFSPETKCGSALQNFLPKEQKSFKEHTFEIFHQEGHFWQSTKKVERELNGRIQVSS